MQVKLQYYLFNEVLIVFIKLSKEQNELMISSIQEFFYRERDEELTEFAAERVLDFIKQQMAPHFYNAAISDAIVVAQQQYSTLEEEMLSLERPIKR